MSSTKQKRPASGGPPRGSGSDGRKKRSASALGRSATAVVAVLAVGAVLVAGSLLLARGEGRQGAASTPSTARVKGSPAAPVTVAVWSDYQ